MTKPPSIQIPILNFHISIQFSIVTLKRGNVALRIQQQESREEDREKQEAESAKDRVDCGKQQEEQSCNGRSDETTSKFHQLFTVEMHIPTPTPT
jgi:hypothetical protein